ncbi:MAG TPA: hypothetical protein VMU99_09130 [Acidimicrobiales bacterium]|nr:hypothetical protein [Acidimicrobiales bacterium]
MDLKSATVLRASVIWAVWVWAVLVKNMLTDHTHGIGFRLVHIVLAVISIGFAIVTWIIVRRQRRAPHRPANQP